MPSISLIWQSVRPYKIILLLFLLAVVSPCCAADSKQPDSATLLKRVKEAIKQASEEGVPGKDSDTKLPYDDAHMTAILCAAQDYIALPVSRALSARLKFKPRYRDAADITRTIRRPAGSDSRHHRLGDETITVEIKQNDDKKTVEGYDIAGGDVESVRQIGSACFLLQQALKDTPLDTQNARFYCPALKSLNTLTVNLPKFAERYLEIEAVHPRTYEVRLSDIETKRKELILIQKEWLAEMAALRKASKKSEKDSK
jgi:hypothetical protein